MSSLLLWIQFVSSSFFILFDMLFWGESSQQVSGCQTLALYGVVVNGATPCNTPRKVGNTRVVGRRTISAIPPEEETQNR